MPTGFHLVARMMGSVSYITRSEYADRAAMFAAHTARIRHSLPAGAKARSPLQINDILMNSGAHPRYQPRMPPAWHV